jgi:hypothetical protein
MATALARPLSSPAEQGGKMRFIANVPASDLPKVGRGFAPGARKTASAA